MALTGAERQRRYRERLGADVVRERRRASYLANKEKVAQQSRAWAVANPEKVLEKAARYRERHPERVKEAQAKYGAKPQAKARYVRYRANAGKDYKAAWKAANLDRVRQQYRVGASRRRARLAGNGVYEISDRDMQRLLSSRCQECSGPGEHVDHIIPVSRGGRHSVGNLQMLCATCNTSKGSKVMTEWRAYKMLVAA